MLLKAADRLILMQVLPQQGDMLQTKIVSDMRQKLAIPEAEQEELEMKKDEAGNIEGWEPTKDTGKEFTFGPRATVMIKDALQELSKTKKLMVPHLPLWEKFVGPIELEADEKITVADPVCQ